MEWTDGAGPRAAREMLTCPPVERYVWDHAPPDNGDATAVAMLRVCPATSLFAMDPTGTRRVQPDTNRA